MEKENKKEEKEIKKDYTVRPWLAPIIYFGLKTQAYEFVENLSYFLTSGMSIFEALVSIESETKSRRMKKIVSRIKNDVESGMTLSGSFERQKFFDDNIIQIIRTGEQTGKMAENLQLVIVLNDQDKKLKSKLNSSLLYGTIIIVLTVVVGTATVWFTLPKIANVYAGMGVELPLITRMLMELGFFLADYGYIIIPFFFAFIVMILYFLFSFPKTKFIGHFLLFHFPFIKRIIKESEITRFGSLLGNFTQAGMPINQSFSIMPETTTFRNYGKLYEYLSGKIAEGIPLSQCLHEYKNIDVLMPFSVLQMISSAEKSGKLTETFFRISELYSLKLENTSRNLPIVVEPLILIVVGLGVAAFVLATMMPIYNLVNIIK